MKYGESTFDIIYLLFGLVSGLYLLKNRRNKTGTLMGISVLVLAGGDAFHLVPRVLNYFIEGDFTAALGIGKAVTSVTMTIFYVLLFQIWQLVYQDSPASPGGGSRSASADKTKAGSAVRRAVIILAAVRIILCFFPQNRWLENESSMTWGILRNIPFVLLGIRIIILYYRERAQENSLRRMWLLITLSFLFYIPVAVFAGTLPILGMLMLPKTICYMLMIWAFLKY